MTRALAAAGVIALAIVLFVLLRPEDEEETGPEPRTTTTIVDATTTTETSEATTEAEPPPSPPGPTRLAVVFRDGRVVGGAKRLPVEQGDQVVLSIRSDVADHVHLHGYDLLVDVAPGRVARIRFEADRVGRFEVELEDRHLLLAELQVEP